MKALKQTPPPSKELALRMQAYDRIDKILTKQEARSKVYRCPDVRGLIYAIGKQVNELPKKE